MSDIIYTNTDSRGREELHRVVYIEYQKGVPHAVITDSIDDGKPCGICTYWDLDIRHSYGDGTLMHYESGSNVSIKEIQGPHYVEGTTTTAYWIHADAGFADKYPPINCTKLVLPLEYKGSTNPFENSEEVLDIHYCETCEGYYDEDACPDHMHYDEERGEWVQDGEEPAP